MVGEDELIAGIAHQLGRIVNAPARRRSVTYHIEMVDLRGSSSSMTTMSLSSWHDWRTAGTASTARAHIPYLNILFMSNLCALEITP